VRAGVGRHSKHGWLHGDGEQRRGWCGRGGAWYGRTNGQLQQLKEGLLHVVECVLQPTKRTKGRGQGMVSEMMTVWALRTAAHGESHHPNNNPGTTTSHDS
jgi:hypothetical protein